MDLHAPYKDLILKKSFTLSAACSILAATHAAYLTFKMSRIHLELQYLFILSSSIGDLPHYFILIINLYKF